MCSCYVPICCAIMLTRCTCLKGMCGTSCEVLLTLFRLQKRRVLQRVKEGGRAPKAVMVRGEGLGSWDALTHKHTHNKPKCDV